MAERARAPRARRARGQLRPTIADIAAQAGVSSGAVSYALNGRPGVSEQTRQRVLEVARQVGWTPNSAARALSGVGSATVGMTIARPASVLGVEPFFMSFVAGVEEVLSQHGFGLLLQVLPEAGRELTTVQQWWSARRVDGVFVTDLRVDDPRVPQVVDLGLPAVVVGDPAHAGPLPSVWSDDAHAMGEAVDHLARLGHRRIARVTGPEHLVHTRVRSAAFERAAADLALTEVLQVAADYTIEAGTSATRRLLSGPQRPTALVFDNDLTALGAVKVAGELGLRVPEELSILAWDDSALCRLVEPALSAMSRDVSAYGADAARSLLAAVAGEHPGAVRSSVPHLVARGSTGAAPVSHS